MRIISITNKQTFAYDKSGLLKFHADLLEDKDYRLISSHYGKYITEGVYEKTVMYSEFNEEEDRKLLEGVKNNA